MTAERSAAARLMGTDVDVQVCTTGATSSAPDPSQVLERLADLEQRWSRFRIDSEVSRLNRLAGAPAVVSPDTATLLAHAVLAWRLTGGRFDPLLGDALVDLGYDRSFPWSDPRGGATSRHGYPVEQLQVDERSGLVQLPAGARFDPGGIGKGLAADIVTAESLAGAAPGVGMLLNVGGDLRVGGDPPPNGWEVEVDHLVGPLVRVGLTSGALATSSRLRRRWRTSDGRPVHHVVDPRTRQPTAGPAASVTVLAESAWWAEALATATLVDWSDDGPSDELLGMMDGCGALVTTTDGTQSVLGARADEFMVVGPDADGATVDDDGTAAVTGAAVARGARR